MPGTNMASIWRLAHSPESILLVLSLEPCWKCSWKQLVIQTSSPEKWKTTYNPFLSTFPGAGSEHRGEGGGLLRAYPAICLQWDSNVFPPSSLLHLPKPTDSPSSPPQDRCCLNLRRTKTSLKDEHRREEEPQFNPGPSVFANGGPTKIYRS